MKFLIKINDEIYEFGMTNREWELLFMGAVPTQVADEFVKSIGYFSNHSVMEGFRSDSEVQVDYLDFLGVIKTLQKTLSLFKNLISYDYTVIRTGKTLSKLYYGNGYEVELVVRHAANCYMRLFEQDECGRREVGRIDCRSREEIVFDDGQKVQIKKKKIETVILDKITSLVSFVESKDSDIVSIERHLK